MKTRRLGGHNAPLGPLEEGSYCIQCGEFHPKRGTYPTEPLYPDARERTLGEARVWHCCQCDYPVAVAVLDDVGDVIVIFDAQP